MGIGAGRPAVDEFTKRLDLPYGSAAQRLGQVRDTVTALRDLDGPHRHTPVLLTAGGPRARQLAAHYADTVTLALSPLATRTAVADMIDELRIHAGDRADDLELALNVFDVGDHIPPHLQPVIGVDAATLATHDSLAILRGSPAVMADELRRRRDQFGFTYIVVNAAFADDFAPVLTILAD